MRLRVARHTTRLQPLVNFYQLLGLAVLGRFENHNGYDGVFLGIEGAGWHLEFTTSAEMPQHKTDDDDLLVLYQDNNAAFQSIVERLAQHGHITVAAVNPYWNVNGSTYTDPDGYRIVIVKPTV